MPHGTYLITVPLGYATLLPYLPRILGPSDRPMAVWPMAFQSLAGWPQTTGHLLINYMTLSLQPPGKIAAALFLSVVMKMINFQQP
jgi:hypothetical protein